MKRVLVNGLAVAVVIAAPLAGHSILSGVRGGLSGTASAATHPPIDYAAPGYQDGQVTPRPTPARPAAVATPTPRATPMAAPAQSPGKAAPAQTGKAPAQTAGKAPAQTAGKTPAQAPAAKAPAQAPRAAAPAQAPHVAAAPAQAPHVAAAAPVHAPVAAAAPVQARRAAAPAAPAQHVAALPRTGGLPLEGLALMATTLLGAGLGLRRFWRK